MTLGEHIAELRKAKGWSQKGLARKCGLHPQTLHRIEHGRSQADWLSRKKIAHALGIQIEELDQPQEDVPDASSPPVDSLLGVPSPESLSDAQILQAVFTYVRELERRGGGHDPATPPTPKKEPPSRPGRAR